MTSAKRCHAPGGWEEFSALLAMLGVGALAFMAAGLVWG